MWDVFIINSVKHLQTWPKTQIRDRYKPISKNTKTLDPLLYYIKGKQLWSSESWIFDEKKIIKNIKITSNIHACTPSSITHLDVYIKNYIQIGRILRNWRGFRDRVLHFQLSPTLSRKDNSITSATGSRSSSLYLSFWNTNYQYQFQSFSVWKRRVFWDR